SGPAGVSRHSEVLRRYGRPEFGAATDHDRLGTGNQEGVPMNTHIASPPGKLTPDEFLDFIEGRPREEHWQLIDGVPFMMSPAMLPHQRIGANLMLLFNAALSNHRPEMVAMQEVGLHVDKHRDTRVVADVAVVDFEVEDVLYGTDFYLAAEVLSDSNTREH